MSNETILFSECGKSQLVSHAKTSLEEDRTISVLIENRSLAGKPKISGPLNLLGFRVVDSNLLHSSSAGISQDSCRPMNRAA